MTDKEKALAWLYKQLKKKRIALDDAERKPNRSYSELLNIKEDIACIEYIAGEVLKHD